MIPINTTGLSIIICSILVSLLFAYFAQKRVELIRNNDIDTSINDNSRQAKILMAISCFAMWLPSAFRLNVGLDNDNYLNQFNAMTQLSNVFTYYEPGYALLCYLCKTWFDDYQVLLFVTAMLTGCFMWRSIYKYSNSYVLCIMGYIAVNMYFMSFTVIRQFIAVAILTTTIGSIKERQFLKFLLIWLFAVCFHYTALVFFVLYFLHSDNDYFFSWKNCLIIIGTVLFFSYYDQLVGGAFTTLSALRDGYSMYEESDTIKNLREIIFLFPILLYALFFRKNLNQLGENNVVLTWVVILLIIAKIIGIMSPVFSRIHYYFVFAGPILMSYAPKLSSQFTRVFVTLAIVVYYVWSINLIFNYQWEDFLPYYSIFDR